MQVRIFSMTGLSSVSVLGGPVAAFVVTWMTIAVMLRTFADRILDHPNERSLHQQPIPRTGGIGVAAGLAVSVPLVSPAELWPLWLGAALLLGISFFDDLVGLPIVGRLIIHFVVASGFVAGMLSNQVELGWASVLMVAIVWMTNLYNFMDGMDGLAGGMAVFGFGFLAIASWFADHNQLALVNASIAAAAAAFLLFNFHPARMFLGDAGSTTFGFLAAGLGLVGWREGIWSIWFPVLVFSPFIVDATVTLARRVWQGERFWRAHRAHYYQRLVLSGWSHRKTALVEYGLMLSCGIGALAFQWAPNTVRLVIIGFWAAGLLVLGGAVTVAEQRAAGREALNEQ